MDFETSAIIDKYAASDVEFLREQVSQLDPVEVFPDDTTSEINEEVLKYYAPAPFPETEQLSFLDEILKDRIRAPYSPPTQLRGRTNLVTIKDNNLPHYLHNPDSLYTYAEEFLNNDVISNFRKGEILIESNIFPNIYWNTSYTITVSNDYNTSVIDFSIRPEGAYSIRRNPLLKNLYSGINTVETLSIVLDGRTTQIIGISHASNNSTSRWARAPYGVAFNRMNNTTFVTFPIVDNKYPYNENLCLSEARIRHLLDVFSGKSKYQH